MWLIIAFLFLCYGIIGLFCDIFLERNNFFLFWSSLISLILFCVIFGVIV